MSKTFSFSKLILPAILLGIILRLYLLQLPGHKVDMPTFNAWGHNMLSLGPADFFDRVWTDYLPLPLYLTAAIKFISNVLNIPFNYLFKLTFTAIELLLIFLVSSTLKKPTHKNFWIIMTMLSPAFFLNTSWWGQVDTIPALLAVLALTLLFNKNTNLSAIAFALAVGIKPIILLSLPAFILLLLRRRELPRFTLISLLVFLLPALPPVLPNITSPLGIIIDPFRFLVERALEQASTYPYQTINGFNLWFATGGNWARDTTTILSVSSHTVGLLLFGAFTIALVLKLKKKDLSLTNLSLLAGLPLLFYFSFATRMHERHMLFALPFLLLATSKLLSLYSIVFILLSISYSLNLYSALIWVSNDNTWPLSDQTMHYLSLFNIIATIYLFASLYPSFIPRVRSFCTKNYKILLITALALTLRLFNLGNPTNMAFDEVYHAFTAREMLFDNQVAWEWWNTPPEGYAYEWTHPPLAKYFMVSGMFVMGTNPIGWRISSAVFGAISIYLIYLLGKIWLKNEKAALLTAFLLTFEGLHLSQSRIAMNDIFMVTFMLLTLYLASSNRWKPSAIALGLTLASKWSGIYTLVPLGIIYLQSNKLTPYNALSAIRLLIISALVYILAYFPFFEHHDFNQFRELHSQMWNYHTNLEATHDYQSKPLQWILSIRPVWYSVNYMGDYRANTYAQSNPAIAWLGLIAAVLGLMSKNKKVLIPLLGYFAFLLPWIFSPRPMFFYHYLPSVIFLVIILADFLMRLNRRIRTILIAFILATFLILSPVYIGYKVPVAYWESLFTLFPTWK